MPSIRRSSADRPRMRSTSVMFHSITWGFGRPLLRPATSRVLSLAFGIHRHALCDALVAGRLADRNAPHVADRFRPLQINRQQAVVESRRGHFDAFGQHETSLKLPGRNAAIEINAVRIVFLPALDGELAV